MSGRHAMTKGLARSMYVVVALLFASISAWNIADIATAYGHDAPASITYVTPENAAAPAASSGCLGDWHGAVPHIRPIARVLEIDAEGQTAPAGSVWAGEYDPVNDRIAVLEDCASDLTLAHEYGHALLYDVIIEHVGPGAPAQALFAALDATGQHTSTSRVPEWLRPVFDEYRTASASPYGDGYFGASFNEYFAESFAWTANRSGMDVPPAMTAFFDDVERAHVAGAVLPGPTHRM
jgi:hypothetical protein